ncbi:MAG: cyclic pyranopterin monophosphate synthase MoaC [Deinococcus sp.]|nr:cyclic pyranopterin monophosphate synthase MoaC [Deinococcus sp.]
MLTHLKGGRPHMVDVAEKPPTHRVAVAAADVKLGPEAMAALRQGTAKGDVLAVAQLAGITAAKRTWELIPLCHQVALAQVDMQLELVQATSLVHITATAQAVDRTGVEMEALTAATVAALTVYDMLKAVERGIEIVSVRLLEKRGGRSGHWKRG